MEHVSRIGLVKTLAEVAKNKKAAEIFNITAAKLPTDCPLRLGDHLHFNALVIVLGLMNDDAEITEEKICGQCKKGGLTICCR